MALNDTHFVLKTDATRRAWGARRHQALGLLQGQDAASTRRVCSNGMRAERREECGGGHAPHGSSRDSKQGLPTARRRHS
eukprot:6127941-Pleurochrysis_carterae.AAC.1